MQLLHNTLQSAQYGTKREDAADSELDLDDDMESGFKASKSNPKFRKSDVLSDAMAYVNQTEVEMRHMENEIKRLSERNQTLEKMARCEDCRVLDSIVGLQVRPI
jgi:TolA-binding protein